MILTEDQRRIVEAEDDHILVLAGAGCGKTTTLVSYVRERIGGKGDPRTIVLTFTNKAAEDVKEKLRDVIPDYESRMFVGTIHEFCHDMVRRYGANIGLDPEMRIFESYDDRLKIFADAVHHTPSVVKGFQGFDESDIDSWIKGQFDRMGVMKRSFEIPDGDLKMVYDEYDQTLRSMGAMDFDDLLLYAYRIVTELPEVAEIYSSYYGLICVDESQDLDLAQYSVIRALADGTMKTLFVGDPNQSIYGFSGASSRYMCEYYPADFDVRRYHLRDNFRSSRAVIEAARMIEPNFEPVGHVSIEGEFSIECYDNQDSEARGIARTVRSLLDDGHRDIGPRVDPEGICVMARSRYVLKPVIAAFEKEGIGYTLKVGYGGPDFVTDLFKALWNGIKVMINPRDRLHLEELNGTLGLPSSGVLDLEAVSRASDMGRLLAGIWDTMETNDARGVFDMADVNNRIRGYMTVTGEGYELSRDMEEWEAVLDGYMSATMRGTRSLSGLLSASSLRKVNPENPTGVVLSTVHMSKGLEYDAVFIMGVNKGVFPDSRARTEAQLEEERHDMFVAITRAKRVCHVSWASSRVAWGREYPSEPSEFIRILQGVTHSTVRGLGVERIQDASAPTSRPRGTQGDPCARTLFSGFQPWQRDGSPWPFFCRIEAGAAVLGPPRYAGRMDRAGVAPDAPP